MPNVTAKHCNTLNPASLMPLPTDGDPHDCVAELDVICSPRPDLTDEPRTTCKLAKEKSVTIHTDSRYAFGVVHDFGTLWKFT